jgi:hypothetical protein
MGLPDLQDLRHEATSRLSERLNELELGDKTGHFAPKILSQHTDSKVKQLACKRQLQLRLGFDCILR